MQELIQLYREWSGHSPAKVEQLPRAGSNRVYVRLYSNRDANKTVIGVIGQSKEENHCFIYLSKHFASKGLPVPSLLAASADEMRYLQTDLGGDSLYSELKAARDNNFTYSEADRNLIAKTIRQLPHIQVEGAQGLDFSQCLEPTVFDFNAAMFDLNYFKYCFLRATELDHNEVRLEYDMQKMANDLTRGEDTTFLFRDFQARNVMLVDKKEPYFIDYQGGRMGPLQYDVASFLWQASARYPNALREEMIGEYLDELSTLIDVDKQQFIEKLKLFVLFRILQVLGAYGFRGYFERKKYFLDSIPPAIQNMRRMLFEGVCSAYPYLEETLKRLAELPQFNPPPVNHGTPSKSKYDGQGRLTVRVFSFSYAKGIPQDESGNGGGYVFDCRATHNPGRYEQYKKLTGLDQPVIKFLEDDGEILTFLDNVYKLADVHVQRYMQRGFTDLMFSFGCTGGQHRSVYAAQHLAEYLSTKYGIEVKLCHREQNISKVFKRREIE